MPAYCSTLAGDADSRRRFMRGAELLGLNTARKPVVPQQLILSDMLAAGCGQNAVMVPRRSSKSTTLIAESLGRAEAFDDYRAGILTMTTGKAGRSRFLKDVVPVLERRFPDRRSAPLRIVKSAGQERVEFHRSGGSVAWLSSIEDLRGEAFDLVILDEAGEPEPGKVEEALAAALPTLDTRPDAQIIMAGTAGRYRSGNLLWDALQAGREGHGGILEYSAPDWVGPDDIDTWEKTLPLVLASHPGVGTLTTVEAVERNWRFMKPEVFMREYLSLFGIAGIQNRVIPPDVWSKLAVPGRLPAPPDRFALALTVHRDQTAAALTAAWRDGRGKAHLLVLAHDRGVGWVQERAAQLALRYKTPIVHDSMGVVLVETEALARRKQAPRLEPQRTRDVTTAAALLMKEITAGRVVHHDQPALNDAVKVAVKRRILSAWGFGTSDPVDDITPLEGAAMALRAYDQSRPRRTLRPNF